MGGYKLFRRDRQQRRDSRVAFYVKCFCDYVELGTGNDKVELLCMRIRGRPTRQASL